MTRKILPPFVAVLFAVLAASCASEPERPELEGYFATFIEGDGTKNFQYTLDLPEQRARNNRQPSSHTGGYASGSSARGVSGGITASSSMGGSRGTYMTREQWEQLGKRLENMLERELKNSAYCHQGYKETERLVEPPTVYIRGECKEKASDEDRVDFPNNVD